MSSPSALPEAALSIRCGQGLFYSFNSLMDNLATIWHKHGLYLTPCVNKMQILSLHPSRRFQTMSGLPTLTGRYTCQEGPYRSRRRKDNGFAIPMPKAPYKPQNGLAVPIRDVGLVEAHQVPMVPSFWSTKMARSLSDIS